MHSRILKTIAFFLGKAIFFTTLPYYKVLIEDIPMQVEFNFN